MIKYLGSKRTLLPAIVRAVRSVPTAKSVLDLFSGTSRVGHVLKREGFLVIANDHNSYAHTLAQCYVAADREMVESDARKLINEFNHTPPAPGYFTATFCERSRFFQPKNGARIDAIREAIESKDLEPALKAVVLVALMEAADRVDSTCGLQMAYLKTWAARAHKDLELRLPDVLPRVAHGPCQAHALEAKDAARALSADVAYIDPPYNQHSYLSNYHAWESLVRWDKPEVYGTACKRIDCRTRKSDFNFKGKFHTAMKAVIDTIDAKVLIVSFNNEGYIERGQMQEMLSSRGEVSVVAIDHKRYVGAQIGIYNPQGDKVGKVSHLRNLEYLYIVRTPGAQLDLSWLDDERAPKRRRASAV